MHQFAVAVNNCPGEYAFPIHWKSRFRGGNFFHIAKNNKKNIFIQNKKTYLNKKMEFFFYKLVFRIIDDSIL